MLSRYRQIKEGTSRITPKRYDYDYITGENDFELLKNSRIGDVWINQKTGEMFICEKVGWNKVLTINREHENHDIKIKEPDIPYIGLRIPSYEINSGSVLSSTPTINNDKWVINLRNNIFNNELLNDQ